MDDDATCQQSAAEPVSSCREVHREAKNAALSSYKSASPQACAQSVWRGLLLQAWYSEAVAAGTIVTLLVIRSRGKSRGSATAFCCCRRRCLERAAKEGAAVGAGAAGVMTTGAAGAAGSSGAVTPPSSPESRLSQGLLASSWRCRRFDRLFSNLRRNLEINSGFQAETGKNSTSTVFLTNHPV